MALLCSLLAACANVAERTRGAHPRTVPVFVDAPEPAFELRPLVWTPPLKRLIDDALAQSTAVPS